MKPGTSTCDKMVYMDSQDSKFKFDIPAQIHKSKDGEWRIFGLASTPSRDLQGEVIDPRGLDLSPIKKGRGVFNFDHKKGPENIVGVIENADLKDEGLYLGGYLFKNHDRAKAVHQIMSSLNKSDRGRMGMSVEGVVQKRAGKDGKTISKAKITSCALTMNPVNTDTYVDIIKSLNSIEFDTNEVKDGVLGTIPQNEEGEASGTNTRMFTAEQVLEIVKALGVGAGYATQVPADRSGGDALAQEDLDEGKKNCKKCNSKSCKCPKKLKKMSKDMYKSTFLDLLNDLKKLHPETSTADLFEAIKDRLNTRFPKLKL